MADRRATAPVLGVVLLVAVTVTVGAAVAVYAAGQGDAVETPAVGRGAFAVEIGAASQRVTVRYLAGPPLAVDDLAIAVDVEGGPSGRLVDLPTGRGGRCYGDPDDVVLPGSVAGDPLFSRACGDASGAITAKGRGGAVWRPGMAARFRIKRTGGGVDLDPGDGVDIAVVDASSETAVLRRRVTVE